MLFIWDPTKAETNLRKHGVSFELAQTVFDDPLHVSVIEAKAVHEERWVTIGRAASQHTLIVVHMYRELSGGEEWIRIISARKATKREVHQYEKGI